jgi:hypothetical protein
LTLQIDDAGTGDILFGVVIGAFRPETNHFIYNVIDVKYFQEPNYGKGLHYHEAQKISIDLIERLVPKNDEQIIVCNGDILDKTFEALKERYGEEIVERGKIQGYGQYLMELAYTNELRNIGYEPIKDRTKNWGKSFWHMYNWIKENPHSRLKLSKSAFPNLKKYSLFQ